MPFELHKTDTPDYFVIRGVSRGGIWVVKGLDEALAKLRELVSSYG